MEVNQWVPRNCKLFLVFTPGEGWIASLRLCVDYLGYLVTTRATETPEAAIAAAREEFLAGRERPETLDVAKASYFRLIHPPAEVGT